MEMVGLKILEVDAHHAKGVMANMLFMVWRYETQAQAYTLASNHLRDLHARHPQGLGVLQVVETTAIPPDGATRLELPKFLDLADDWVKHYSIVHEGTGFKAAAVRAITSGAYFMSRRKFPHQVFASMSDAAQWHATAQEALGYTRGVPAIEGAIRELRKRLEVVPPPTGV